MCEIPGNRSLRLKVANRLHVSLVLTKQDRFLISRQQQAKLLGTNESATRATGSHVLNADEHTELVQLHFKPDLQVQVENVLYLGGAQAPAESAVDAGRLPRVAREQLRLLRFLGSGAFGKVYEGLLCINAPPDDTAEQTTASDSPSLSKKEQLRVAVKVRRKLFFRSFYFCL